MKRTLRFIGRLFIGLIGFILIGGLTMYIATKGTYTVQPTVADDPSIPHIDLDGVVFHAETFGVDTNETIIVIHGGPGNDYRYLLPLKALSKEYQVVFYDQRGTGLSPRVPAEEQSLENALTDLDRIVDYYGKSKPVHLIGHSWGAMLASGYIGKHPEKVEKVVLAEPGMLTSAQAKKFAEAFKFEFSWSAFKLFLRIAFESLHLDQVGLQDRMDYIMGNIASVDMEGNPLQGYFCGETLETAYLPSWRAGAVASQAIMAKSLDENGHMQIDLIDGVDQFQEKVLFITGACNQIIGTAFQQEHVKYFPNVELVEIPDAGHTMFGEQTEVCLNLINRYLAE